MGFELIVIGTSRGGVNALETILSVLPKDFSVPVAIVLHRHKDSDDTLGDILQKFTSLTLIEAEDKEPILPGHIYIAPSNYHLLAEKGYFSLSTEEPVIYARPSIDLLFESAAFNYKEKLAGIILTGGSKDGAFGMSVIKKTGGFTIAQDPEGAEDCIMPKAAIETGYIDKILPLEEIGTFIANLSGKRT